jgi:hypothetical protein
MRALADPFLRSRRRLGRDAGLALVALAALVGAVGPARGDDQENPFAQEKVDDSPYPVEFRVRVNEAIQHGVRFLKATQQPAGSWKSGYRSYPLGPTALGALTLLKCGVPPDDPAVERAFAYMREQDLAKVYEVGVLMMAIAARYAPSHDGFTPDETDAYGNPVRADPCKDGISDEDQAWMKRCVTFLVETQNAEGVWRYPNGGLDVSNTQYALLGLQAANRCGTAVPAKVWLAALKYLVEAQDTFGKPCMYKANEVRGRYRMQWSEPALARGFRYIPEEKAHPLTGSMTTAGLAGLIICQSELWGSRRFTGELRTKTRRGIRDAMAWLQQHYDVERNPVAAERSGGDGPGAAMAPFGEVTSWYHYYMYGLERAGILGRFRFLGDHDWYAEGAEALLGKQTPQGSWGPLEETAFALLFLKRATARHSAPVITPSGDAPK